MKVKSLLIMILIFTLSFPTYSFGNPKELTPQITISSDANSVDVGTRGNQTCYYYKKVFGTCYKRLWSITFGYWMQDTWYICKESSHNHVNRFE